MPTRTAPWHAPAPVQTLVCAGGYATRVSAQGTFDAESGTYALTFNQSCPATPGQTDKAPFVIPMAMGLLSQSGQPCPCNGRRSPPPQPTTRTFVLTEASQTLVFAGLKAAPVPSLLRGFSAPVQLDIELTDAQLLTLLAHDEDAFNRWEAGQRLALRTAIF
jgi:aminopeptidase N